MRFLSMCAKTLSVRRSDYDQGVVIERLAAQKTDQLPDCGISSRDCMIVRSCVRSMGIRQMHPEKEGPVFVRGQPIHRTPHHLISVAFD